MNFESCSRSTNLSVQESRHSELTYCGCGRINLLFHLRTQHRPGRSFDQRPRQAEGGVIEIDIRAALRQQLAAAGVGDHRQEQVGEEGDVVIAHDFVYGQMTGS